MYRTQYLVAITFFLFVISFRQVAISDIVLTGIGVTVTEDYNDYRGSGFAPGALPATGQLDSNTYRATGFSDGNGVFGGTHTTGDFARGTSTGGISTGGTYAFELAPSDFAVGVQPTADDFTPGTFTIRVSNQTGSAIKGFNIQAEGWTLNDQNRSSRWVFAVSTDDSTYFDIFVFDSDELADSTPAWEVTPFGGFVPFISPLANGGQFFIRITGDDLAGTGSRDEFALDNLAITAVPEPSVAALMATLVMALAWGRQRSRAIWR